jgi:amino acid permease
MREITIVLQNSLSSQIIGLIILGIVLDLGGGPSHDRIGFRYWKHPGAFNQLNSIPGAKGRFLAFWATFIATGPHIQNIYQPNIY